MPEDKRTQTQARIEDARRGSVTDRNREAEAAGSAADAAAFTNDQVTIGRDARELLPGAPTRADVDPVTGQLLYPDTLAGLAAYTKAMRMFNASGPVAMPRAGAATPSAGSQAKTLASPSPSPSPAPAKKYGNQ